MKLCNCLCLLSKTILTLVLLCASFTAYTQQTSSSNQNTSKPQEKAVWPGTSTRYYPGIYPAYTERGTERFSASRVQNYWESWFKGRENNYKEFVGDTPVTHLGVSIFIDPSLFFTEHWRNSSTQPYNWKGICDRISAAADPDAAPNGQPLYEWSRWDELLNQPFIAKNGGKVILKIQQTYTGNKNDRSPQWMRNEGYIVPSNNDNWWHSQMQDWATVYMWQDIVAAFAARYKGDSRIASINMDEAYPSDYQNRTMCGLVHNLKASKAVNSGLIEIMKAYLDVDPGMLWAMVNWHSAEYDTPVSSIDRWESGYGGQTIGVNDLPGVQGHWINDPKFFNTMGSGSPGTVDAKESGGMNTYLYQYYGVNRTAPVFAGHEAHGWNLRDSARETHRTGSANPWNIKKWPRAGGSLPNDGGKMFPSARFWAWYMSGAPRAEGDKADSKLGQVGRDPAGVAPANFYVMAVPTWFREDRPAWNKTNLSIQSWLDAFDTFGPRGTKAMFAHPDGYLEQFSTGSGNNSVPVALDDNITISENTSTIISVLMNDSDADGDTLTIQSFKQGLNGSISQNGNKLVYMPNANFVGKDSFTYEVVDGKGGSDTAKVSVTIKAVVTPPGNDSITVDGKVSDWKGISPIATASGNQQNLRSLKMTSDADKLYFLLEGQNIGANTQIHLNVDNNAETGYQGGNWKGTGIDYLIENNWLYKSQANDASWSWGGGDSSVIIYKRSSSVVEISIKKSVFSGLKGTIRVGVWDLNSSWSTNSGLPGFGKAMATFSLDNTPAPLTMRLNGANPMTVVKGSTFTDPGATVTVSGDALYIVKSKDRVNTNKVGQYILTYTAKDNSGNTVTRKRMVNVISSGGGGSVSITIDGKTLDWLGISAITTASGQSLRSLKVTSDADKLYFLLEGQNIGANTQIHLNVDDNVKTGYQNGNWKSTGIDYLIENNRLYKSKTNNASWSWDLGDSSGVVYKRSSSVVEVSVKKSAISRLSSTIKIGVWDLNSSWNIISGLPELNEVMSAFLLDSPPQNIPPIDDNALKLKSVNAVDIKENSVLIKWVLTDYATGQVEYGLTQNYGNFTKKEISYKFKAHGQPISGLSANTLYNFRVISTDKNGKTVISKNQTFKTERSVSDLDKTPPMITLQGLSSMNITVGNQFVDPGATAIDDVDGDVKVSKKGVVNGNKTGTYTITYSAKDKAGNSSSKKRVVKVIQKSPQSTPYLEAVRLFADTVINYGRDNYGNKATPLFVDNLNVDDLETYRWSFRDSYANPRNYPTEYIAANYGLNQQLLITLRELSKVTGDTKYLNIANEVDRFGLKNLQDPNGLFYWGHHETYDALNEIKTVGNLGEPRHFIDGHASALVETKTLSPDLSALYKLDEEAVNRYVEQFFTAGISDWKKLAYGRHLTHKYEYSNPWSKASRLNKNQVVPFVGAGMDNYSFGYITPYFNLGFQYYNHTKDERVWRTLEVLIKRNVDMRNKITGLAPLTYAPTRADGWEVKRASIGRYIRFSEVLLKGAELLGVNTDKGRYLLRVANEELGAFYKYMYFQGKYNPRPLNDTSKPRGSHDIPERMLWVISLSYRLTGDKRMWDMARGILNEYGYGDIGDVSGKNIAPKLNGSYKLRPIEGGDNKNQREADRRNNLNAFTIHALMELYEATGQQHLLEMGEKIGDTILSELFVNGLFVRQPGGIWARLADMTPLALLHLEAARRGITLNIGSVRDRNIYFRVPYNGIVWDKVWDNEYLYNQTRTFNRETDCRHEKGKVFCD